MACEVIPLYLLLVSGSNILVHSPFFYSSLVIPHMYNVLLWVYPFSIEARSSPNTTIAYLIHKRELKTNKEEWYGGRCTRITNK